MKEGTLTTKIYNGLNIVYFCIILSILFWIGLIIGLGIFGLAPSLLTCFHLAKLEHKKELDHSFKTFFKYYFGHFFKGNQILGLPLIGLLVLLMESKLITTFDLPNESTFIVLLSVFQGLLILIVAYASSMYQFYALRPMEYLKKATQFMLFNLPGTLLSLLLLGICYIVGGLIPGLIPFFIVGFAIMLTSGLHLNQFEKNEIGRASCRERV